MTRFGPSDDLSGAAFVDVGLRGARFTRCDLSRAVLRAVDVDGAEVDAPWLSSLWVNGVDVAPFVEGELDRRFPGRGERGATSPDGLRRAWTKVEHAWAAAVERVAAMPPGTADVSVAGEWSFAQTLRHLVMATDTWFRVAVQGVEKPYHPLGVPNAEYATDGYDTSIFAATEPPYAEVLEVRAGRVAMVRDFLAAVTSDDLVVPRRHPWAAEYEVTTLECLHTILTEEWEHLRYATRDLDAIAAAGTPGGPMA
ncbi:DinB family protein [Actinokineospora bangkokensis]|uniref:DinB superfamily protein n=1 Tax=Actinokineospora bangkokensis TaxID=1193682 RepID=A0A1Q9LIL2_9PSEU|nr:DinB family protein [Actinokineospora bangkokensis]OLR91866.1 DinB superfamily protein [Actinokineospora bangkokensis]